MEHIEEAGIHSGDSACSLPPYSLPAEILAEIRRQAEVLARALDVRGLMNVQMAIKDREVFILEVNPRASRTVPFVAKAIGRPIAKIAARVMAGESARRLRPRASARSAHVAVKEAVFPFARFPGRRSAARPGDEVDRRGHGPGPRLRRRLRQVPARRRQPAARAAARCSSRCATATSRRWSSSAGVLLARGYQLIATRGTAAHLRAAGLEVELINKVFEGRPHIVDRIKDGQIAMVLNTTEGQRAIARQLHAAPRRAGPQGALLHHGGRRARRGPGDGHARRARACSRSRYNPIIRDSADQVSASDAACWHARPARCDGHR